MSGVRSYSFREGDRSEYLAQFLLSALGLCSSIPRQEDIGFDFSCSIADQEDDILTFGYPYLISIKSLSKPSIDIKPSTRTIEDNDIRHVAWLFRQNQPIFLGVVDKVKVILRIFSLLPIWFVYYEGLETIGSLSLNPRFDVEQTNDVVKPPKGAELTEWPNHFHYDVDLGHPIAILDLPTIKNETLLLHAKRFLRTAVEIAERNLVHYRLHIPHFNWFQKTTPDTSSLRPAFAYYPVPPNAEARSAIMAALAPSLISFALHFKEAGDHNSLQACARLLTHAPPGVVPPIIFERIPELKPLG